MVLRPCSRFHFSFRKRRHQHLSGKTACVSFDRLTTFWDFVLSFGFIYWSIFVLYLLDYPFSVSVVAFVFRLVSDRTHFSREPMPVFVGPMYRMFGYCLFWIYLLVRFCLFIGFSLAFNRLHGHVVRKRVFLPYKDRLLLALPCRRGDGKTTLRFRGQAPLLVVGVHLVPTW